MIWTVRAYQRRNPLVDQAAILAAIQTVAAKAVDEFDGGEGLDLAGKMIEAITNYKRRRRLLDPATLMKAVDTVRAKVIDADATDT